MEEIKKIKENVEESKVGSAKYNKRYKEVKNRRGI